MTKMLFRGITYEKPHTELAVEEAEIGGIYRGSHWKIHRLAKRHACRHNLQKMTYRGIAYYKK